MAFWTAVGPFFYRGNQPDLGFGRSTSRRNLSRVSPSLLCAARARRGGQLAENDAGVDAFFFWGDTQDANQ